MIAEIAKPSARAMTAQKQSSRAMRPRGSPNDSYEDPYGRGVILCKIRYSFLGRFDTRTTKIGSLLIFSPSLWWGITREPTYCGQILQGDVDHFMMT